MGRFRIYAQNGIQDGILENIKSENYITSTSVTLCKSRHIFWEIMFGGFTLNLKYRNGDTDPPSMDTVLVARIEEAKRCLQQFMKVSPNPFVQAFISQTEFELLVERFINHISNRLDKNYIIYNISEVMHTYYVAKLESEFTTAIKFTKDFYTKILLGQPYNYQESLYALSGSPFKVNLQKFSQIECLIKNPTLEEYYVLLSGVDDM
jgi:hypothetical protein